MSETTIHRTLVKSPPELWAEVSDDAALARHLGEFGEIRITRTEPEKTVAWEGERASGTVHIEPGGWGTRVVLSVEAAAAPTPQPPPAPPADPDPDPDPDPLPPAATQPGVLERLRFWSRRRNARSDAQRDADAQRRDAERVAAGLAPAAVRAGADEPSELAIAHARLTTPAAPPAISEDEAQALLERALDTLGQAHHRPFSRG
ncbi:MAG: hypothetical protein MSC31_10335 [Solirubrobacteraceae bacterium MAG38_C4-C5]|nr:hypothetical protein [Candidatus Siliceabacter maunaloa]